MVAARPGGQRAHKFFLSRRPLPARVFDHVEGPGGLVDYPNVPPGIGFLISRDPSLLAPLSTTLGLEDMYDLIEVALVDACNDRAIDKWRRDRAGGG